MTCFSRWYRCIAIESSLYGYRADSIDAIRNERILMNGDEVIAVAYIIRFNAYRSNRYLRPTLIAETELYHFMVVQSVGKSIQNRFIDDVQWIIIGKYILRFVGRGNWLF